ncbi:MAG: VirB4-like conjugal transfer ATPase, CD1110 family [Candidatus Fimivivens sp.]
MMSMPKMTKEPKTKVIKRIDPYAKLPRDAKKKIARMIKLARLQRKIPRSAQRTIPYDEMYRSGLCIANGDFYTRTVEFNDANYRLAKRGRKTAIFESWCRFLNYFDSSTSIQLSFVNQAIDVEQFYQAIAIPEHNDAFNALRAEYVQMLQEQLAKGNNGLLKRKFITFGIHAESSEAAQLKLDRMEAEVINAFKQIGVYAEHRNGYERLEVMHDIFNIGTDRKLNFAWDLISKTGLTTKDFIAPTVFNFKEKNTFELQERVGRTSYLRIDAKELPDDILSEFLNLDSPLVLTIHLRSIDQVMAKKYANRQMASLNSDKAAEQKKAFGQGYDMDMLPHELKTNLAAAEALLDDLDDQNERLFLMTFTLTNFASDKEELENVFSSVKQIAQQHDCLLLPLDWQQEAGLMSAAPVGINNVENQRMLTTTAAAGFIPFESQELFQQGGLYYGVNAISQNMIMVDRLTGHNPNGLILGVPGCFTGDTKIVLADGTKASFEELMNYKDGFKVKSYDAKTGKEVIGTARNVRITHRAKELVDVHFDDGYSVSCTPTHQFLLPNGKFLDAKSLKKGQKLYSGHRVEAIELIPLEHEIPVYDLEVDDYSVFMLENGVYVHNSGKSFAAKREMVNVALVRTDDILVLDPEREYTALVNALGGQVIKISADSPHHINPLDLNISAKSEEDTDFDPIRDKCDFILSFCEQALSSRDGLQPIEISVIDRCVMRIYDKYLAKPCEENIPTLQDLYETLLKQEEPEAKRVATGLERFVTGSLNVFNHPTNVEIKNRIVCFDIKDLAKNLKKLGMLVVQDQIWSRVRTNRSMKKYTRYYVDEFHLLLKDSQTASASVEIWKRFRKWGGVPTGITQNVKDFLTSPEIENIFDNSDFIYLLNQAAGDQKILASALNISENQLGYVTNSQPGEGLLIFKKENAIIPFVDHFPKDTQLYRLMTTKLDEVVTE